MTLASDIITKARYTLSDIDKDRWSDVRLISLLNDALIDCAKNTTLFVENIQYVVTDSVVDIDLSAQVHKFIFAEYLDEPLPFYSFDEMAYKYGKTWQLDTGSEVEALVYDKQKAGLLKQYPIVTNAINEHIIYDGLYGVITFISYSDVQPNLSTYYGDISGIPDDGLIKFYYIRKHATVTALADTLTIDDVLVRPLAGYVTGMALRDNQDVQNRTMANEELNFYYQMVEEYNIQKSELFVRAAREAKYRPGGI